MEAVETMILKDDAEKQIVLNRGLLIKTFSVSVYNKKTRKERVYSMKPYQKYGDFYVPGEDIKFPTEDEALEYIRENY